MEINKIKTFPDKRGELKFINSEIKTSFKQQFLSINKKMSFVASTVLPMENWSLV